MRRVLVVSYYFPPSGGPGVQRVLKFVKYLREFGFEPTVLTVEEGAYPHHDAELAHEIPDGVSVHRTRSLDPFGAYARLTGRVKKDAVMVGSVKREGGLIEAAASWLRANVFLPDARVGWVPFAIREGMRLHNRAPFDVLFTSGPPHSVHLIGRKLRVRTGVPWVADFRDLWTDTNFYDDLPISRFARHRDERLESGVLSEANRITTVSPYWKKVLLQKSGRSDSDIAVIHNGFDAEDFPTLDDSEALDPSVFTIAHVGSLYKSRNPSALWAALSKLREEGKAERLRVRLVGAVDEVIRKAIERHGLQDVVEIGAYVSHAEAVQIMRLANALLLVIEPFRHDAGMITGKLYEYVASGSPVIALGPVGGDAAALLAETDSGRLLAHGDEQGLTELLLALYEKWADGETNPRPDPTGVAQYTRKEQTRQLAAVLSHAKNPLANPLKDSDS